ncbi:MAG: diguanylate cyclase [Treponema sp.]|nr:diguanylate cyclase [Treponema sp.]
MVSIKKKLIVLISACTLFATFLLGGISIVQITRIINRYSQDNLQLQCRATKETLDIALGDIEKAVGMMKDIILSEVGKLSSITTDEKYREAFIKQVLLTNRTIVFHARGCVAYYFFLNPELVPPKQGYFWVYEPHYTRFLVKPVPDMTKYTEYDVAKGGRYHLTKKNGSATWILPYYDEVIGRDVISYCVPIYVKGTFLGVVGMDVLHATVAEEVKDVALYETGYAYLLDHQSRAIYHKDYNPGDLTFTYKKNTRAYTLELHNGWLLTTVAPLWEINAERRRLILMLLFATVVVGAIFIYLSSRITQRIINPLMELIGATKKLANGDLNAKLPVDSDDEVGLLAKSFEETLHQLPNYLYRDSLTGVRNMTAYKRAIEDLQSRMDDREIAEYAVMVLDINNLKLTNDQYGHEAGNDLITTATSLVCDVFKHSPIYRIGGDEFVAILEHKSYKERESLIEQFRSRLERNAIFVEKKSLPVSVAVGFSDYNPQEDKTYDEVFKRADEAMYKDKEATKKRLHMPSRSE